MHDEFRQPSSTRTSPSRPYLKATDKTEVDLHTEFRPRAEGRVKTLLVLSKIAEAEGTDITAADVEGEIAGARDRYVDEPRTLGYFDSERGRNFIRSTLRRMHPVETLVDRWLAGHPEHPALPHAENDDEGPSADATAAAAASIGATDPSIVLESREPAHDHGPTAEPVPVSQGVSAADPA